MNRYFLSLLLGVTLLITSCAKFPIYSSAVTGSNVAFRIRTYNFGGSSDKSKIEIQNIETGQKFSKHYYENKIGFLTNVPPGNYKLNKMELICGSVSVALKSAELDSISNQFKVESGKTYFIGTFEANIKPGMPPTTNLIRMPGNKIRRLNENSIDQVKTVINKYGYSEKSLEEIQVIKIDSMQFKKFGKAGGGTDYSGGGGF